MNLEKARPRREAWGVGFCEKIMLEQQASASRTAMTIQLQGIALLGIVRFRSQSGSMWPIDRSFEKRKPNPHNPARDPAWIRIRQC
jgi:hypothetical protein